jgi:calcium/calmodulin-dependent protein kinase I
MAATAVSASPVVVLPQPLGTGDAAAAVVAAVAGAGSRADAVAACATPPAAVDDAVAALRGRYVMGRKLGRGTFATVYCATESGSGRIVAIKVVDKKHLDEESTKLLENELYTLESVSQHPGVVTFYESVETERCVCFVLEFISGGPLLDKVVERGTFSENDARIALRPVLRTLSFMAKLGVVHRDIKPENMLVDNFSDQWPVKLTDFGLSAKLQKNKPLYSVCGTPMFVAPEVIKGRGYDCSCDMWSIGVTLYTILCGYPPFFEDDISHLISKIVKAEFSFPPREWDRVSEDAKDIVRKMLAVDPRDRVRPDGALAHPWFSVEQSTKALPNSSLRNFNARRKMRWAVNCVRTTCNFWGLIRPDNFGSDSTSSEYLRDEVQRNAAAIAELDRVSSSNNPLLSNEDIAGISTTRSDGSAAICADHCSEDIGDQIRDDLYVGLDEQGDADGTLTGQSGQYRSCRTDIGEHASPAECRRSLLLPTLHFVNGINVESSVTSARASVSFRAKAMIAEIDTYDEGSCGKFPEQSPFRSMNPSLEAWKNPEPAQDGPKLARDNGRAIRSQVRQPPIALKPLDFDGL